VGWAAAGIGALLQIKPLVQVLDGEVRAAARIRTFGKAVERLQEFVREQGKLDQLAIIHSNNEEGALAMRDSLKDVLPTTNNVIITRVGPTLGTHIGPGGLGFASVSATWKA
jgi:fatty acid-binding protein DegV